MQDFLSLELGNSDVILGIQWLETLGSVRTNWKTQTMQFKWEGRPVMLVGDPSLKRSKISLKTMIKELNKEVGGILVEYNGIKNCLKEAPIPDLKSLFDEYDDIFQPLTSLPPT